MGTTSLSIVEIKAIPSIPGPAVSQAQSKAGMERITLAIQLGQVPILLASLSKKQWAILVKRICGQLDSTCLNTSCMSKNKLWVLGIEIDMDQSSPKNLCHCFLAMTFIFIKTDAKVAFNWATLWRGFSMVPRKG